MNEHGNLKCQESFMLALQKGLHKDLGTFHQYPPRDSTRDFAYVSKRTRAEGLSFLTKTLPALAKSLDLALVRGTFQCPSSFKRYKGTNLPCFMHGFFKRLFSEDGTLLEEADPIVVRDLRQVGYLFYKYQLPYPDRLVVDAVKEFIEDDSNIVPLDSSIETQSILYYAKEVVNEIFKENFFQPRFRPKNGPGSVANGKAPWQRYKPTRYYKSLDSVIPYDRMFYHSDRHLFDCWSEWFGLSFGSYATAKLIAVPKDSRGPRLISSEQSEYMSYQQCYRREIVPHVENHHFTRGQVSFTDQSINGRLALSSSIDGKLATLDLSKASDLLSLDLVDALFDETHIHHALMNTRSTRTKTPLGNQILRKFAPMGSALCFPIQAITYYALIVGRLCAIGVKQGVAARSVYVYGDDIIVPTKYVHEAIEVLEAVGLRVNYDKSCYTGKFRESCGVDAFKGVDVTPTKIKKLWNPKPDVQTTVSWLAICNQLFANGFWFCSDYIRTKLNEVNGTPFPLATDSSPVLGFTAYSVEHAKKANRSRLKWNRALQCWSIRAKVLTNKPKARLRSGWQRLLRKAWEGDHPIDRPLSFFTLQEPFTDRKSVV